MQPRIIKLIGTASTPITVQAEIFDDKFSNVDSYCEGSEGEEFMNGEMSSGFSFGSAKGKARRAAKRAKRVAKRQARKDACKAPRALLLAGPIGLAIMAIHKHKCLKAKQAASDAAADSASTDTGTDTGTPVDPNAATDNTMDPNAATPAGSIPLSTDAGAADAQAAIEDRDEALPPDAGDDGSEQDVDGGADMGDGSDDSGAGDLGDDAESDMGDDAQGGDSEDGMGDSDNEAMGQDGGDDQGAGKKHKGKHHGKHKGKHKNDKSQDSDSGDADINSDDSEDSNSDTQDYGDQSGEDNSDVSVEDISEVAEFAGKYYGADGKKPNVSIAHIAQAKKIVKLHDSYMKRGADRILKMAKDAGVTPPSAGGNHDKWEAFLATALKKVTPFQKVIKKMNLKPSKIKTSSAEGGVMIGTHKEEPNEIHNRHIIRSIAFNGDMAFSPEGGSDDISLFGSEPLSNVTGPGGRKHISHTKHGRKVIRYTGVPKDNLTSPLLVKKGAVTVVSSPLNPLIRQNKITIPADKTASDFTGTGLIGLDDSADYDAPNTDTFYLGADGEKTPTSKMVPFVSVSLLVGGLVLAYFALKSALKEEKGY